MQVSRLPRHRLLQTEQLLPYNLTNAKPFIKWAGGKRHLLAKMKSYLPAADKYKRYHEPFLGSAALFFHLRPKLASLSDRNQELVITFRAVRNDVGLVIERLRYNERQHRLRGAKFYYDMRAQDPRELNSFERAARFIYLNKTCYNGIYRVNRDGKFNVPIGRYNSPTILDEEKLKAASAVLKAASIKHLDYTRALTHVGKEDFVYLDPPYSGRFTSYHQNGFGLDQQKKLSELFLQLHAKGAYLMMSNGADEQIIKMYESFTVVHLESRVYLSGKLEGRKEIDELLVLNYDPKTNELLNILRENGPTGR